MTAQGQADPDPSGGAGGVLVVGLLTGFIAATFGFGIYLFAQLVPDMRADLAFDYAFVGTVTAAAQLGFLAAAVLSPWLAARIGDGQTVLGSAAVCGACLLALPSSGNLLMVGSLIVVMAGTAASAFVPMVEVVARVVDRRHRGTALGLISSGTSYGVFVNSLLVPTFAPTGDWRTVWTCAGLATVAMTALAAVAFWRFGLLNAPDRAEHAGSRGGVGAGAARLAAFTTPWVLAIWATTFVLGLSTFPFQTYLSPYLRDELGFGIGIAAQVWGVMGLVGMVAGLAVGRLADVVGLRPAMLLTYVGILLAALILVFLPTTALALAAGILFSAAFYPIFGLVPAYVSKRAANGAAAVAIFGIANVTQGVGGMIGNALAGFAASATGTFAWGYAAAAVLAVVLGALLLALPDEQAGRPGG